MLTLLASVIGSQGTLLGIRLVPQTGLELVSIDPSSGALAVVGLISKTDGDVSSFGSSVDRKHGVFYCALTPDLQHTQYFAVNITSGDVQRRSLPTSNPHLIAHLAYDEKQDTLFSTNSLEQTTLFTVDTDTMVDSKRAEFPPSHTAISSHGYALDSDAGVFYAIMLNWFNFTGSCQVYGVNVSSGEVVSRAEVAYEYNRTVSLFYDAPTKAFVSLTYDATGAYWHLQHFDPVVAEYTPFSKTGPGSRIQGGAQVLAATTGLNDRTLTVSFTMANATYSLVQFNLDDGRVTSHIKDFSVGKDLIDLVDSG